MRCDIFIFNSKRTARELDNNLSNIVRYNHLIFHSKSFHLYFLHRFTQCPPGRTVTLSMAVFVAEILFNVWTVAFNFVPGGVYTREHTDWLIAFVALTLALATVCGKL